MTLNVEKVETPGALERAVAAWTRRQGGGEALAAWAMKASRADRDGNSAIEINDADAAALAGDALLACVDAPFAIEFGHFYLQRNLADERAVAEALRTRLHTGASPSLLADAHLDTLFDGRNDAAVAPQRAAVRQVRGQPLFVLTGGPGTGKTTTVLRMLLQLAADFHASHGRPPRIVCCAPTGKAAQRLGVALAEGAAKLSASPAAAQWHDGLKGMIHVSPSTVHRYLSALANDADQRADIFVLDEASMLDLRMMHRLLSVLPPEAQLVLVGDAHQLASVETGSVFSDIVQALRDTNSPALVELQHSFRAIPELQAINQAAHAGDLPGFKDALSTAGARADLRTVDTRTTVDQVLTAWSSALGERLAAADAFAPVPGDDAAHDVRVHGVLAALAEAQLLCAVHQGTFGTIRANQQIETRIRTLARRDSSETWYPGRAILVTQNDHPLGLYNGDIGVCLADADGSLHVWFSREAGQGLLRLATHALPPHAPAFALSIHKSQGSEYPEVAVLLPSDAQSAILSRQLLYTAVSRAKSRLHVWSGEAALGQALATPVQRIGALRARLAQ